MKEHDMTENPTTGQTPADHFRQQAEFKTAELLGRILIQARKDEYLPAQLDLNNYDHLAKVGRLLAPYVLSIVHQYVDEKLRRVVTDVEQTFSSIFGTQSEPGAEAGPAPTGKPE